MPRLQAKNFATPDGIRTMPRMTIETVALDEARVGRCAFEPGWRWSTDVAPLVGPRHARYATWGTRCRVPCGSSWMAERPWRSG